MFQTILIILLIFAILGSAISYNVFGSYIGFGYLIVLGLGLFYIILQKRIAILFILIAILADIFIMRSSWAFVKWISYVLDGIILIMAVYEFKNLK